MVKKSFFLSILIIVFLNASSQVKSLASEQILVVTTDNWDVIKGDLNAYELKHGKWEVSLTHIPVTIGRNGMAWGKGLQDQNLLKGNLKKEGDGRSPAGIFHLYNFFGYEDIRDKVNYIKSDKNTFCVDDPASVYYNKIVQADTVKKDWSSAEDMLLKSNSYKYGIVIGYNSEPVIPTSGSCVFLHIWSGNNAPTAGCTAMTEENILKLFSFLKKEKNPLIVQVPVAEYKELRKIYLLPEIK